MRTPAHIFPSILTAAALCSSQAADRLVTVLVPGFRVQELPVQLSNINNLRFSPDGVLTALGYDGRIHLLKDTDSDGLEDTASPFWDQPTLTVPVGMSWTKDGLYVSSNGKISLFPDADRNGQADREIIITTNWQALGSISGNVDATAITADADGNLYFGLLTENYANPYLLKDGKAHYSLSTIRGTIQKWDRATRQLETVATGIRVPYNLAFNKHGDLFNTDQEGETWCPNGNPLDELNHILVGKNYGFPPRHPEHLPNLLSEPPVVGFGPQHQSTCGFVFNEPSPGQKLFGPASWEDDAFVTGESRGVIWRVPLVKTPFGYLGKDIHFARLQMLTTDVAVSPRGHLYISCHSGPPDWGTGPKGEGKLFRISYSDPSEPLPVAVWPQNPMELRVAFDKPLHPDITNHVAEMEIDFGEYVRPADRLENLKPPYKVVAQQQATPRGKLKVVQARLSADARTLSLVTDPHPQNLAYALMLPGVGRNGARHTVDLGYNLHGVEVLFDEGANVTRAWLPHLDSAANRLFTIGSVEHEKLYSQLPKPGVLTARTRVLPPNGAPATLRLISNLPFDLDAPGLKTNSTANGGTNSAEITLPAAPSELTIRLKTGDSPSISFHAAYFTADDPTLRPLPFQSLHLPWAPLPNLAPAPPPLAAPEIAGGDYERGRELFFNNDLKCSACHRLRGEGTAIGPDLSNLVHRDAASVLQDIREPNIRLNPDHTAYNLVLTNGTELTGFARAQSAEALRLIDAAGQETLVPRGQISSMQPSSVSLMPTGLIDSLNDLQVRDLLTYLLHEPPIRQPAEVKAVLRAEVREAGAEPARPLKIVLVANKQDHGPGQHDYPRWQTNFNAFLARASDTTVGNAWDWPSEQQFESADSIVFYYWNRSWSPSKFGQMDRFLQRGGGMALFHSSTISDQSPDELAKRIGLAAQPVTVKYLHAPMDLKFVAAPDHPITAGFKSLHLLDEPYWPMIGDTNKINVLATARQDGADWPMIWTMQSGQGRVFASIPGHYTWTHDDPMFRVLVLRAIAWTARQKSDRFRDLINIE